LFAQHCLFYVGASDAVAAARHWHSVAEAQAKELEAMKHRLEEVYEKGKKDGESSGSQAAAAAALKEGILSEEEERQVLRRSP